jgi:hypothetical protein
MITLFRDDIDDPKRNAQRNLSGRTHYVDEGTLRWHKSRVLSAASYQGGLLFGITTSEGDAAGYKQGGREYRAVIFDVFGFVIDRTQLEQAYPTHKQAQKALADAIASMNGHSITAAAIVRERNSFARELDYLEAKLGSMTR